MRSCSPCPPASATPPPAPPLSLIRPASSNTASKPRPRKTCQTWRRSKRPGRNSTKLRFRGLFGCCHRETLRSAHQKCPKDRDAVGQRRHKTDLAQVVQGHAAEGEPADRRRRKDDRRADLLQADDGAMARDDRAD